VAAGECGTTPAFGRRVARLSPEGAAHADEVVRRLIALWKKGSQIPSASLTGITTPTLVMAGERDMVALARTTMIARSIPGARLCIVPGTGHLLVRERPDLIANAITQFLRSHAV
jgi:pimeloyl-ACP methyl ester carboxylesterase